MRDDAFVDAARPRERTNDELLRHADAKTARDQLVPDEALGAAELAPRLYDRGALLLFGLVRQWKYTLLDPAMQRHVVRARDIRQQQRHRLRQIADGIVGLLEQPRRNVRLFHRPFGQAPNGDEPLRPVAAEEVHGPRRIT